MSGTSARGGGSGDRCDPAPPHQGLYDKRWVAQQVMTPTWRTGRGSGAHEPFTRSLLCGRPGLHHMIGVDRDSRGDGIGR